MPGSYRRHTGGTGESNNGSVTKTACFACSPGRAAGTSSPDLTSTGALPAVPQAAPGASRLSELRNLPGSPGLLSQDQKAVIFFERGRHVIPPLLYLRELLLPRPRLCADQCARCTCSGR